MPYVDKNLQFLAANTDVTVTFNSDVIDLGYPADFGPGQPLWVNLAIQESFAAAGAGTLTLAIEMAKDDGTGNPGAYTTIVETAALAKADLVAGKAICIPLPPKTIAYDPVEFPRFYRLTGTVATGPFTAGQLQAFLGAAPIGEGVSHTYPSGFAVQN